MKLLDVRKWFIQNSGRYDLVVDSINYPDNGADRYIRAGQRYLDREFTHQKTVARFVDMLAVGQTLVSFTDFRVIQEVWLSQDQIGRWKLEKKSMDWMRLSFPNMDTLVNGRTLFYCPTVLRNAPHTETFDGLMAYLGDMSGEDTYLYNGIHILPPPEAVVMVEIFGYVYSDPLLEDTSQSFWSVQHPEILVMAAQLMLEIFNRNTEGVKDWQESLRLMLDGISKDDAEEDSVETDEMEGWTEDTQNRTRRRRRNRGQVWYW